MSLRNSSVLAALVDEGFTGGRCPVTNVVAPNMSRSFGNFHISYCRHSPDYGSDTTALVLQGRVFFILNGFHASAMVAAAEADGVLGCVDLFVRHIEMASSFSEHMMATGLTADPFQLAKTTLEVIGVDGVNKIIAAAKPEVC